MTGTPEGSTESGFMEKPGIEPATQKKPKLFVAFPWVETSTGPGLMICVFINMTGTPEGSTESGFMEKPGIEPATPGLQGIVFVPRLVTAVYGLVSLFSEYI